MKRLKIVFKDGSQITYTIRDYVAWEPYFNRHNKANIKSAVLQKYPLKNNDPIVLV
jgi:hypothetical protein